MHHSILLALTAASAVLAAPAPASPEGIKVSLANRRTLEPRDDAADMKAFLFDLNRALGKYKSSAKLPANLTSYASTLIKRANNEPLTDQVEGSEDELYYGSGTVGAKQPQTFTFDFDTGSSDLFVPGPSCGTTQGCVGTTKYSQTGTDEHNTTTVTYGSGSIMGENYFDSVTIAGLTATNQNIVSLTSATGFSGSDSNSLLGMAFQSIANSGQPPYFQTLISQGKVATKEFAFYLGRSKSGTQGNSELTLGGRDTSKFTGAVTQVPVTSQTYWQVALDAVTVNGKSAGPTTKGQAAIDTGTTIIIAPTIAATAIFANIPGSFPLPLVSGSPEITLFAYPCSYSGTVAIQFAGKQFVINKLDFNFGQLTGSLLETLGVATPTALAGLVTNSALGGTCIAAIAAADLDPTENLYVVGDSFLKNWYSIYSFTSNGGSPAVLFAAAAGNQ